MTHRCGYVTLLGRPNAGKSTLLNSLVGDKLAVVSRKPQTTRNRILGIAVQGKSQILFVDTPGIHHAQGHSLMNTAMNRVALAAAADSDLILYLVDVTTGWTKADETFLSRVLAASSAPFAVIPSKVDALPNQPLRESLAQIEDGVNEMLNSLERPFPEARILHDAPCTNSAKRPESIAELKTYIASKLPPSPWLFDADDVTDLPESFLCAELIREQLFRQLGQEIPYGCAVKVESLQDKGTMIVIAATVIVNRASHKGMVIGSGGQRIKNLGMEARASLERHFNKKIFLDLDVSVANGWTEDEEQVAELASLHELLGPSQNSEIRNPRS